VAEVMGLNLPDFPAPERYDGDMEGIPSGTVGGGAGRQKSSFALPRATEKATFRTIVRKKDSMSLSTESATASEEMDHSRPLMVSEACLN
jgi:hypothetical protein